MKSVESLQAQILNLSKERNITFQLLLSRFGSEQFLYRLSVSKYSDQFVFKGGSLLLYLTDSERKTRDLDFSIKDISNHVDDVVRVIESVLSIKVDDGIEWQEVVGEVLNHPEMDVSGVRTHCHFLLGKMKGSVHMDMAFGDVVNAIKVPLQRIKYKGKPFFEEELILHVYPLETVFAEKFYIALTKGAQNTRMKDYYDLFKLCDQDLNHAKLKHDIKETFSYRNLEPVYGFDFDNSDFGRLETYWKHFLNREEVKDAPGTIGEVIIKVNTFVKTISGR
jgi:predicted nucleotidyltransferase component of viral defense system